TFWTIYCDRENNLWFGSWGAGLVKYSGSRFTYVDERYGLLNNSIIGIAPGSDSSLWFSSEVGLSRYNPFAQDENYFTNYDNCNGKKLEKVMGVLIDRNGSAWMPGYFGSGYKLENGKVTPLPWLIGFCIMQDHLGRIWRGGDNTGIKRFDPNEPYRDKPTEKQFLVKEKSMNRILGLYEDSHGNVWGMNDVRGVNVVMGDSCFHFEKKDGFVSDAVQGITEDGKGRLWLGMRENGLLLCKLNENRSISILDSVTTRDGLSSNSIGSLIFDRQGDLVIGTLNGLSVLHMKEYDEGKKIISSYARTEGFRAGECNQGICLDKLGRVWLSSAKGAWCYDPSAGKGNELPPITHITGADLFFEPTDWKQYGDHFDKFSGLPTGLELPYNKNHITFHFSGISLTAPSKVKYQYMMAGIDRDWSPADNRREVTYPNLPPGNYTFLVKACNNNGTWNTEPVSFRFSILPPFWQRTWFYALVMLALVAGVWYYVRWRERKLKIEKSVLEEKVRARTVELRVAYGQIEEKNKDITDSINYAKRLQQSILPSEEIMHKLLPHSFVLYLPKDIVSGDFYWMDEQDGKIIFASVDCTGHGVPGALMSMVGNAALNEIVLEGHVTQPDKILAQMREKVIRVLRQKGHEAQTRDGFDIAICSWDGKNTLQFSGANNPLFHIRAGELKKIAGDKQPVGTHEGEAKDFTLHTLQVQKEDLVYIMSDGYADQFGGPKGKKFKQVQLQELLRRIHHLPVHEQKKVLAGTFDSWRGSLAQVDDVCIIGVKF
ncbi:MAG TPA: triple tyrosine motif-containing protein, partial [Bacteroidia bacterium]